MLVLFPQDILLIPILKVGYIISPIIFFDKVSLSRVSRVFWSFRIKMQTSVSFHCNQ